MIVHDLRNPLAAVTLYLQLLKRKGSMSAESIKYLDLAAAESQKMSNFLDDMLMLAKMERGKLTLSYSPLYLERLIASAHAKFDLLAEAQGVQFSVEMPAQPYPLMADVALFQRVVENLVANALKFAPAQTTITAVVEYPRIEDNEAAQLRISVRDEGRGIPVGDSVRMFDQYEAVYMKEHGKSELGLELAFCRMVAEAHGGSDLRRQ